MQIESACRSGLSNFPVTKVPIFLIRMEDMDGLEQRGHRRKRRQTKDQPLQSRVILDRNSAAVRIIAKLKICPIENGPSTKPSCGSGSRKNSTRNRARPYPPINVQNSTPSVWTRSLIQSKTENNTKPSRNAS